MILLRVDCDTANQPAAAARLVCPIL